MTDEVLTPPGLVPDPRTEEAKAKDYQHSEVAMAVPLQWARDISQAPTYSLRDQNGSGSCVAQATAKALETLRSEIESAHPTYFRRVNFPTMGMYLQNAGEIIKKQGTTSEALDPSQRLTEDQMNQPVTVQTPINGFLYAFVPVRDIDEIAQAIEVRKHCLITIAGTLKEYAYSDKPVPDLTATTLDCLHCICGVYYFTDEKGEKCILIDESWGPNHIRRRILTESYLKARGTGAMYYITPTDPPIIPKPHYYFTVALEFGMYGSLGVKYLQDILKYEGLFPANVASTGNYLEVTRKAVLAFQRKHQVASEEELIIVNGKRIGPKTIKVLNSLYN